MGSCLTCQIIVSRLLNSRKEFTNINIWKKGNSFSQKGNISTTIKLRQRKRGYHWSKHSCIYIQYFGWWHILVHCDRKSTEVMDFALNSVFNKLFSRTTLFGWVLFVIDFPAFIFHVSIALTVSRPTICF
jgi:hypothetical protein